MHGSQKKLYNGDYLEPFDIFDPTKMTFSEKDTSFNAIS